MKMKIVYSINFTSITNPNPNTDFQKGENYKKYIVGRVNEFKGYPGLFAYYVNDEMPFYYNKDIRNITLTIHELDPNHPALTVIMPFGEMPSLLNTTDIMGVDNYPIGNSKVSNVYYINSRDNEIALGKPQVQVNQIYDMYAYNDTISGKPQPPTLQEMRSMSWQNIVLGAKGLLFYSLYEIIKLNSTTPIEVRWKDIIEFTDEIWKYKDVILSIDKVNKIEYIENNNVVFKHWKYNNNNYIAIVNLETEKEIFIIDLLDKYNINKEFGLGTFEKNGTEIILNLEPIDVMMIKFSKNSSNSNNLLIAFLIIIIIIVFIALVVFFFRKLKIKYDTKIFVDSVSKLMND